MADSKEPVKKELSGYEYRKRKAEKEKRFQVSKKSMMIDKYFIGKSQELESSDNAEFSIASTSGTQVLIDDSNILSIDKIEQSSHRDQSSIPDDTATKDNTETEHVTTSTESFDVSDAATWPEMHSNNIINHIISVGASQIHLDYFPKDENGRHFSISHYSKKLSNDEVIRRRWLVYSVSTNRVFCFCCRLFDRKFPSNLVFGGFNKWKHLAEVLKMHENSTSHKKFYTHWIEAEMRLKIGAPIDKEEQKLLSKEKLRSNNVLIRLIHITQYLAEHNMAFRGTSDKLYTPNNGNFLGLVQLLAKFDPIMEEHVKMAMKGDISDHYCGKNIQHELIEIMALKAKSEILSKVKKSKYYSIIADCTPDISHTEQLSLTIRFADITDDNIR